MLDDHQMLISLLSGFFGTKLMKMNDLCPKCQADNVIGAFVQDESTGIIVE